MTELVSLAVIGTTEKMTIQRGTTFLNNRIVILNRKVCILVLVMSPLEPIGAATTARLVQIHKKLVNQVRAQQVLISKRLLKLFNAQDQL
jgi:hypothetical protein